MGNYIKIDRKILEWEWYKNINTCRLFFHFLLKANWKDGRFEGNDVPRGAFVTSVKKLALETALTEDEVRTALLHLIQTGEVTKQTTNKFTVITVSNYELYQEIPKQNPNSSQTDTELFPNNSHSIPNLFPTIEEEKESKEGKQVNKETGKKKKEGAKAPKKKEPAVYYPNDEKLNQAFADFVDMRRQIKKPMTDRAVTLAMNKLKELSSLPLCGMDNDLAIKILNQSTMNCWQGLFPLKGRQEKSVFDEWRDA